MAHKIKALFYLDAAATHSFALSIGEGSRKEIMTVTPYKDPSKSFFRVVSHDKVVIETVDLQTAIDAYNEEP
jgi:hypothetical protein